jgi:hypothetical protein
MLSLENEFNSKSKNDDKTVKQERSKTGSNMLLEMQRERRQLIGSKLKKREEEESYLKY